MDDVEHITSKAIHVSQNLAPNIQYPVESDKRKIENEDMYILLSVMSEEYVVKFHKRSIYLLLNWTRNLPKISLTLANVMTRRDTNKSAIANDAKNRFPILRRLLSV